MTTIRPGVDSSIETTAQELLSKAGIDSLPIAPDKVARLLGLDVEPTQLGEDVSGVLIIQGGTGSIGYNAQHSKVRQRFTTAHEIGHYVLHGHEHRLFIDKRYSVYWRDEASSTGERLHEVQANQFAAALLMPKHMLLSELDGIEFDLADEEEGEKAIAALAKRFNVSTAAMTYRLLNLGFVF